MSKLAKFLASKKKLEVKASVDSVLQAARSDKDALLDVSSNSKVFARDAKTADEWGADSDSDPVTGVTAGGGHFHLITEEDVSKKQQRKARTWGEVSQEKQEEKPAAAPEEPTTVEEPVVPEESPKLEKYVAPRGPKISRSGAKLDTTDLQQYPDIGVQMSKAASSTATSSSVVPEKKDKRVETIPSAAAPATQASGTTAAAPAVTVTKHTDGGGDESLKTSSIEKGTLMLIEELLHDIEKPKVPVIYDDDLSKSKYNGRKKKSRVHLSPTEL